MFSKLSKSSQVTQELRKQILGRRKFPGSRLQNVRELSREFDVSTKVIMNALDALEAERLVIRQHGSGVFVRAKSLNNINVGILRLSESMHPNTFFDMLVQITGSSYIRQGYNFTIRIANCQPGESVQEFEYELQQIERSMLADCLVIVAPGLSRQQLDVCHKVTTPILFIGDFSYGEISDLGLNQISMDSAATALTTVERLSMLIDKKEFLVFIGSRQHYFNEQFAHGLFQGAEKHNLKCHIFELPYGTSKLTEQERSKNYIKLTALAERQGLLGFPAINAGVDGHYLKLAYSSCYREPNFYQTVSDQISLKNFYDHIYLGIDALCGNPPRSFRDKIIINQHLIHINNPAINL